MYNGWTNRATWNINLHVVNDQSNVDHVIAQVKDHGGLNGSLVSEIIHELFPEGTPDMSLSKLVHINLKELARSWTEAYSEG